MTKFENECNAVAESTGVKVFFCRNEPGETDVFKDDGVLHVRKHGVRAVFDVSPGQNLSGREQNERTRKVLVALKMEKFIKERALVDEDDEDEEDVCPCCGRPR